ncbi:MAG TPA: hypothetical protein VGD69_08265 [Herpetosiphonaceae bacterium]
MIGKGTHALSTSLLLARLGKVALTPPSEQQLVERLLVAATDVGCRSTDLVKAIYVGLKLHLRVCLYGPARDRTMALFESLVTTVVGAGSEQVLHLHGPIGGDEVAQRFAAIRIGDFVGTLIEPIEQGKAWFILIDTPGDPTTTLRWVEREVAATLRAGGRCGHMLPANLFILVSAGETPSQPQRCWLSLAAPEWGDSVYQPHVEPRVPPVGYQRQLLENQLTGPAYRSRLRRAQSALKLPPDVGGLSSQMARRWLAASVDDQQRGIWIASDPAANARHALEALEALHMAHSCSV